MLEIKTAVKAKVTNVTVLSQKNRPVDEAPGAKLKVKLPLTAAQLEQLAPGITKEFFEDDKKQPKQAAIEGVEQAPTQRLTHLGLKIAKMALGQEFTGYKLTVVRGTARSESNLLMTDSIIAKGSSIELHEGGGGLWTFDIESGNVKETDWGKFAKLKSTSIEMMLEPPVVTQEDLDLQQKRDAIPPAPARKPGAAEKAAVANVKGAGALPKPTPHKGTEKPPRTARGKAATKAALEKGAKGSEVAPEGAWPFPKPTVTGDQVAQNREKVKAIQAGQATDVFVAGQAKH